MTELEIMSRAKDYIDKMANGINPLTGENAGEDDVINNVRISRCFFYVSDILGKVIDNGGYVGSKPKKQSFSVSDAELQKFPFSDKPVFVSDISKALGGLVGENVKSLPATAITKYFVSINMLEEITVNGQLRKRPTEEGIRMGITSEQRQGKYGMYTAIWYSAEAQHFIIDNIRGIIEMYNNSKKEKSDNELLDIH